MSNQFTFLTYFLVACLLSFKTLPTTTYLSKHDGNSNGNGSGGGHDSSSSGHSSGRTGITLNREGAVIPIDQGHTIAEGYLLVGASLITDQAFSTLCIVKKK